MMETTDQHVNLPRESILDLRGTRFIVTSHFDDTNGEPLESKLARLLQNDVENMASRV